MTERKDHVRFSERTIMVKEYKVGIIGFGTVGAGVAENLLLNSECIFKRTGVRPVLHRIADLDITTDRGVKVPAGVLTTDAAEVIRECDIVVELVGGTTVAKKFILDALNAGRVFQMPVSHIAKADDAQSDRHDNALPGLSSFESAASIPHGAGRCKPQHLQKSRAKFPSRDPIVTFQTNS